LLSPSSLSFKTIPRGKEDTNPRLLTLHAYHLQAVLRCESGNRQGSTDALQILFRTLDRNDLPVSPSILIESFGWGRDDVRQANDFLEFWKLFGETIGKEESLNATYREIFEGTLSDHYGPEGGFCRSTENFTGMLYMFSISHV